MDDLEDVEKYISVILKNPNVLKMKTFIQHGKVSTYTHCKNVTLTSFKINRKLKLNCNLNILLCGAMLHDFYLYDWHNDNWNHPFHGFTHPILASNNAKKYFDLDNETIKAIKSHMWPFNPFIIPTSKEAWIICFADKYEALKEIFF